VDAQQTQPRPDSAGTRLLRRIEAIAADVDSEPDPGLDLSGELEALATRLEGAFEARLSAEIAALREDLADALEDLSGSLLAQMSGMRSELLAAQVYPKSSGWQR
jgi:hypothetical protein